MMVKTVMMYHLEIMVLMEKIKMVEKKKKMVKMYYMEMIENIGMKHH